MRVFSFFYLKPFQILLRIGLNPVLACLNFIAKNFYSYFEMDILLRV